MATVYILQSLQGEHFYIGSTINLPQRLKHHHGGHTPYTKSLGKVELVFSQEYPTLAEARFVEKKLKALKRKDYIARIISDGYIKIKKEIIMDA